MNRKGFTLVELITTFVLTSVIVVLLINLLVFIKNIYNESDVKTKLLIEQGNLNKILNEAFIDNNLSRYSPCNESEFCYDFTFNDGNIKRLSVTENKIIFDNYTYNLNNNIKVVNPTIEKEYTISDDITGYDSMLIIKIPIESKFYNGNYGANIIYQYNSNKHNL